MERPTLDKRLLFFCLVVGIFATIVIHGAEAKGGGGVGGIAGTINEAFDSHARKGSAISSAKSTYKYRAGGYHGGGTYGRGVVDENLPLWKLLLIILAVCLMVFCILLLCYCIRASQEPDERQAKVTEYLKHQEEQRKSGFPVNPQPIIYPNSNGEPAKVPVAPPLSPGQVASDATFFPPAMESLSTTSTLLPPEAPTPSSSNADTPAPIGFYIPPEIQQVYTSEDVQAQSDSQQQPLEKY
ncbi:Hypothetical predicted protein [Cloeon dipterum]|uniref:Resistance to inhibitors of cholinesterase protein 3 N-terminal domain-containing protein n=1 Tax=Cloeon dipterum TaxID=197152 RepID=A0A8S1BYQ7_9INSE|nr:Hypothetical predicted protein [Cloeon dipterum]